MARGERENALTLTLREVVYRTVCRHRQGEKPNIFVYCTRRSGSVWLLNTMAAHPGMRYVAKPFWSLLRSRWARQLPDLAKAAKAAADYESDLFIHFEGDDLDRVVALARDVALARKHIYPSINFRGAYFHRVTDRAAFQITNATPLIEFFDQSFPIDTVILLRHPIPNALSIMARNWPDEAADFINHTPFVDAHLNGAQMDLARNVLDSGDALARHVLDWTLKMMIPIRALESGDHPHWTAITYEETALNPNSVVGVISDRLQLPDCDAMLQQVQRASRTVTAHTADRVDDKAFVVSRWREKVDEVRERELMRIPESFGIDAYVAGRLTASDRYLHAISEPSNLNATTAEAAS